MITFSDVTKIFFNGQHGLEKVSFTVEPGEMVMITGHTGSGKTTLMRLLTKEYEPTEGEIILDGTPLSKIRRSQTHHLRRRIGVVFQDYRLLPEYNAWENIALPLSIIGKKTSEIEQRVSDLLKLVHLESKADLFPSELSGGEAQRISIARALAIAPQVLFADEPTGNLDQDTSREIIRLLKKINEMGTTVLMATHDVIVMELLKDARHLVLEAGKLIKDSHGEKTTRKADPVKEKVAVEIVEEEIAQKTEEKSQAPKKKQKRVSFGSLFKKKQPDVETKKAADVTVTEEEL